MTIRTIEVGRAVLTSSTQNLELWLTTLITISPAQRTIDIQQLSSTSLLELLSSGTIWVGRGNGMHVEISLTLRGEPLPHHQIQDLISDVLEAPIWAQLRLQPKLPSDDVLKNGTASIGINHAEHEAFVEGRKSHRIFSNVPAADVQPPSGILRAPLQAVHFSIDILESKQRSSLKRSKTSPTDSCSSQSQREGNPERDEGSGILLHHSTSTAGIARRESNGDPGPQLPSSTNRKRRRPLTQVPIRTSSSPTYSLRPEVGLRKRPAASSVMQPCTQANLVTEELAEIRLMVDGALRLAVHGLNKSINGLKVKANTFGVGLADVAPALWRPGFLTALTQRAHLLPVITRSFSHVAGLKVASVSLSGKFERLSAYLATSDIEVQRRQASINEGPPSPLSSSVSDRLWLHLQKSLLARPTLPLQAFVIHNTAAAAAAAAQSESDEILEPTDHSARASGSKQLNIETSDPANDNVMQYRISTTSLEKCGSILEGSGVACAEIERRAAEIEDDLLLDASPAAETACDEDCDGEFEDLNSDAESQVLPTSYVVPSSKSIPSRRHRYQ